jgi:hypothetical protein
VSPDKTAFTFPLNHPEVAAGCAIINDLKSPNPPDQSINQTQTDTIQAFDYDRL